MKPFNPLGHLFLLSQYVRSGHSSSFRHVIGAEDVAAGGGMIVAVMRVVAVDVTTAVEEVKTVDVAVIVVVLLAVLL